MDLNLLVEGIRKLIEEDKLVDLLSDLTDEELATLMKEAEAQQEYKQDNPTKKDRDDPED